MQPAQAGGGSGSSSTALRKWGPIAAIAAVIALIGGIVLFSGGDDGDDAEPSDTTTAPTVTDDTVEPTEPTESTATGATEPPGSAPPSGGEITYPLSFTQAEEEGIEVDWPETCDTETGRLAVRDFFAPDCYAPFDGDNGGATAPGVTEDSIKVVYYLGPDDDAIINYITAAIANDDTNADAEATLTTMRDYYEDFYELYGRTVDLEFFVGSGIASDEVAARADAVRIAEEIQPFAVLGGPALTNAFADELAAREVLCISCTPSQPTEWYMERDPYQWGITPSAAQSRQHVAEFVTKQLVGKNAEFAGDEAFRTQPRKFGHVFIESSDESVATAEGFVADIEAGGADVAETLSYVLDPASIQQSASQIIGQLKAAGVTTVLFSGDPVAPGPFTLEATAQEYFPEWVVAASTLVDTTAFARTYDQQQWENAFGVSYLSARTLPEVSGYYSLYKWYTGGEEPPAPDTIGVLVPQMALFHSVTMATGPELTAENWRNALFQGSTEQAISAPFLSWGETGLWDEPDYSGIDDFTAIWWDPAATGPDEIRKEGTGMWQYVDGGTRYLPGEWPTEPLPLFDPNGAVAIYDEPPPGEAPIDYPSPAG
jgi:hypothetical protein